MNIQQLNYKNIGSYHSAVKSVVEDLSWVDRYVFFNFELKNKALNEYERVMQMFPNDINKYFLTLEYSAIGDLVAKDSIDRKIGLKEYEDYKLDYYEDLFINSKHLEVKDENLWIFEKLYKTLTDIAKMKVSNFIVNSEFLNSLDSYQMMKNAVTVEQPKYVDKFIKEHHKPESAKTIAFDLANKIDRLVVKTLF